jgi:hypothetical protein
LDNRFNIPTNGIIEMKIMIELFIELRVCPFFDLQGRCLLF